MRQNKFTSGQALESFLFAPADEKHLNEALVQELDREQGMQDHEDPDLEGDCG